MSRKLNTQPKLHVKKGDTVSVLSGNDKGKTGKILRVFPKKERVLVEGINIRVKHQKANQEFPQGGRISREMPIHVSNVLPLDPSTNQPTRVGRKLIEVDGAKKWVRYAKVSGEILDK